MGRCGGLWRRKAGATVGFCDVDVIRASADDGAWGDDDGCDFDGTEGRGESTGSLGCKNSTKNNSCI